jgi:diaminopimelate epimerase
MHFTKMQGAGNDYIYVDCITQPMPHDPPALSRLVQLSGSKGHLR